MPRSINRKLRYAIGYQHVLWCRIQLAGILMVGTFKSKDGCSIGYGNCPIGKACDKLVIVIHGDPHVLHRTHYVSLSGYPFGDADFFHPFVIRNGHFVFQFRICMSRHRIAAYRKCHNTVLVFSLQFGITGILLDIGSIGYTGNRYRKIIGTDRYAYIFIFPIIGHTVRTRNTILRSIDRYT